MKTLPRFRLVNFACSALPVALLCAMQSLPAAAATINTTPTAPPAVTSQSAKTEKEEIKAGKKTENKARPPCKKHMEQAHKRGQTDTCSATGVEPVPEETVDSNTPPPAGAGGESDPIQNALTGPDAIPAGFVKETDGGEGGEQGELLASLTAVPGTVPEPGSLALLGAGLLGLSLAAMRRKQKAA